MNAERPSRSLQLRSLVKGTGELEISLVEIDVPAPVEDQVLVRVEAAPLNPSDLGLLFGAADLSTVQATGMPGRPVVTAKIPPAAMKALAARIGQSMPVGNEGAGVVIAAGPAPEAQALVGKVVAILGGAMYSQHRCLPASQCLVLPSGTTPAEGASAFVNPLTALGMIETMRREGHRALVHTAAASNLGQMLNRLCLQENIGLVNIVRKADQEALLRAAGARYICNSASPAFTDELTEALAATGATIAFDAIGGGRTAGQVLACMEAAINRSASGYSRYGSSTHKQVYLYGALDRSPTELARNFGMAWSIGGWLLFGFIQKIGPAETQRLKERVAAEIRTTFASRYTKQISLAQVLSPGEIAVYGTQATATKYLVDPSR